MTLRDQSSHAEPQTRWDAPVSLAPEPPPDEYQFMRGVIQGMRCGVLTLDARGRLLLLNEHARRILGLAGPLPAGVSVDDALARHPTLTRVLRESLAMSNPPNRAELDLDDGLGRLRTIGFTISLIHGEAETGPPQGLAMFFKDLTPIEHNEEQERLKDRLAALGEMAASMAHEIRNPLAAIEISCGLLKRRLGSETKEHDLLVKIAAEVRRLNRTVNSSLEFVRPICPSLAPAELGPLLEEAVAVAIERASKPGVVVQCELDPGIPQFMMDRTLLRQVFVNLLLNALEAVGERGTVTVGAAVMDAAREAHVPYRPGAPRPSDPWECFEHFAVVNVADDGPGIPQDALPKIFYPFFTTKKNGSGVGLSTAKKIVDSHRGLIDVGNSPRGGATFTVRLPMVLATTEVRAQ